MADGDALPEVDDVRSERGRRPYAVVGIGASAQGAEPLGELLSRLDAQRSACVVVEHVRAGEAPGLAVILRERFPDRLLAADDGVAIEREKIYVTAPGAEVALFQGVFHILHARAVQAPGRPIDFFLHALATDQGASAIGVLLAGTTPDGPVGLDAIKAEGGVTFVEKPNGESAAHDGQIATALADFALTPPAIVDEVNRISRQVPRPELPGRLPAAADPQTSASPDDTSRLFAMIRGAFGTDLHFYKPSTIERRIGRRMLVTQIDDFKDYVEYVKDHPAELESLYKDCLIRVTSFFRDHEPFETLKATILPKILERKSAAAPLRVWVPGCASGEEAYSIAICMFEFLDRKALETKIQIFATDLDPEAINDARRGHYPPNIAHDVSPGRLERFFLRNNSGFQVSRRIRDTVVFAVQDVTRGPPFSHLDLVSCRNLLIYLQPAVQKKVLRVFHHALAADGMLLLGSSESIGDSAELYTVVDKEQRLYGKKGAPSAAVFDVAIGRPNVPRVEVPRAPSLVRPPLTLQQRADRKVLEKYGPPGVLINEGMEVLQFRGRIGFFLEPTPGSATLNLLKLVRPELLAPLRAAVGRALAENAQVSMHGIELLGRETAVHLEVLPIEEPETQSRCFLVLFDSSGSTPPVPSRPADIQQPSGHAHERELVAMQEYLQQTVEELEAANEELQSSNEELQSSNEELQSTNEELETSKEEVQSSNEELNTVNDELHSRMGELSRANDDLVNLIGATSDAIVIVGLDMHIRRFTVSAERLLGLIGDDVGRPVRTLAGFFAGLELEALLVEAIDGVAEKRKESLGTDGRWYRVRVTPYKTTDLAIRGAMLVITDVDDDHRGSAAGRSPELDGMAALAAVPIPMLAADRNHRVVWANRLYYPYFRTDEKDTLGQLFGNLGNGQWAHPKLHMAIDQALGEGKGFHGFRIEHDFETIGKRAIYVSGAAITAPSGGPLVLLTLDERPASHE